MKAVALLIAVAFGACLLIALERTIDTLRGAQRFHLECPCGTAEQCNCPNCDCPTSLVRTCPNGNCPRK